MKMIYWLLACLLTNVASAGGDVLSVGTDQQCDYQDIQSALNAGNGQSIHVTTQQVYRELLEIQDKNITIKGGFADCAAAEADAAGNSKTTISGDLDDNGHGDGTVMLITGSGQVTLHGLKITEGTPSHLSGGVAIDGFAGTVSIIDSLLVENYGLYGGGLGVHNSPDATVLLGSEVLIINNHANFAGGGLFCNDTSVIRNPDTVFGSGISNNTVNMNGGGVYLSYGCELTFKSGRPDPQFLNFRGLAGNQANRNGGGAYIASGARLILVPAAGQTVNLSENVADADDSGHGHGGGAFVTGMQSVLYMVNTRLVANQAVDGGGVYVHDQASLLFGREANNCIDKQRCAWIKSNEASSQGGAIYATDHSQVKLVRAALEFNRADAGTAIYLDEFSEAEVDYSLFSRNGGNGANGWLDFGVFHAHNSAQMTLMHSTVVDNLAETAVFITDMTPFSLNIMNSIVHDPGSGLAVDLSQQQEDDLFVWCSLFHEDSGLYGNDVLVEDPHFMNRNARDFSLNHLQSPAIDECFELSEYDRDYLAAPAGWDDPNVVASGGGFDMGAFESYGSDVIFKDGLNQ
jgi:hypothetical protein